MRRSEVIMGLPVRNVYTNSEKTAAGRIDTLQLFTNDNTVGPLKCNIFMYIYICAFFFLDDIFRGDVQHAILTGVRQQHAARPVRYDERHRRRTADGRGPLAFVHDRICDDRWPGQPENINTVKIKLTVYTTKTATIR